MMPAEGQKLRHECLTCSRPFNSKGDLIKHQYMHREKPQLTCSHCNKTFATELNYKRHLNSLQNNVKKRYHCNNCGKFFQKLRDLESHHDSEHRDDKVFRCGVCQAEFCWHENLLKHKQVHDVDSHVCGTCGRKFIDLTSLLVHKRTCHMSSKTEIQKKSVITKEEFDTICQSDGGKPFTCHICGRGFKFDFSYQAHLDGHVIPATEGNYYTNKQTVTNDPPVSGNTSKSLYVEMDNEGIIDLPALNGTSNEEVEIIVEVGNVATSRTVALSFPGQQIITNIKTKQDSMAEKSSLKATGEKRTSQESSINILKDPDEQTKALKEEPEKRITFYEPYKKRNTGNPVLQTTVSGAEVPVPRRPYLSRPKKPPRRKREKIPFHYNCVMTDDKPFVCSTCGEAFRWEISLQVHIKVHTGGKVPGIRKVYMSGRHTGTRSIDKTKNGSSQDSGAKKSRIVYQRHSSEEEEDEEEDTEDAYAFQNGREEDKSTLLSYQHGKRFVEKKFDAETADDMLQEYLAGGEFSSDGGCNDIQLEVATKSKDATRTNSQSDGCWQKGRIIFTMANTEKVERLKVSDQTAEAGSEKPVATECDAIVMASGNEIAIMTECSVNRDQNFAVACVEDSAKDVGNVSQFGVIGSCLMATFPFDLTAVTNDCRNAMATTYSVTSETVSLPVVMQNGFKQEEATADGGQLMMLQCIPVEASCLSVDKAVLISGTHDRSGETAEVSARSSEFIPMVQNASSEITSVDINDCITHEPTEFKSTACVSHTTSELNDTGTNVIQVDNAMTCSDNLKSGNSTRVIFFADENPIPQVNKVEPPTSYSPLASQAGNSQMDANFAETGISSVSQKISTGLVALKAIVSGARDAGLKAGESHLENSAFESNGFSEGEITKNDTEDIISNAISNVALQNEEEQTVPKNQSAGHVVDIPCQALSDKDEVKLKRLECTHCGKLFTFRALYVKHLRRHSHVKLNYTTCTHCSKKFFSKASLDRHLMLHTA